MKKMVEKLVVVVMMTIMVSVPVFAGEFIYNEKNGMWHEKGDLKRVASYELQEAGTRTVNVVVKNGVSMVEVTEFANVMGLDMFDDAKKVSFTGYDEGGAIVTDMSIYKAAKLGKGYLATTAEMELDSWGEEHNKLVWGDFKTPVQLINNKWYAPAKELIDLVNMSDTKVTFNKQAQTITFEQAIDWYKKNISYVPY